MRLIGIALASCAIGLVGGACPVWAQPPSKPSADPRQWVSKQGSEDTAQVAPSSQAKPTHFLRQTTCNIPFTVDANGPPPLELQLFVSTDRGQSWKFAGKAPPSAGSFAYRALQDGEYWFALRTIDKSKAPRDLKSLEAGLRIVFDTQQPQLDFDTEVLPGGEIEAKWNASDPYLLADSLRIEYQSEADAPWRLLRLESNLPAGSGSLNGAQRWRTDPSSDPVVVRAEIRDRAGNTHIVTRRITPSAAGSANATVQVPVSTSVRPMTPASTEAGVTWPKNNQVAVPVKPSSSQGTPSELPPPKLPAANKVPLADLQPDRNPYFASSPAGQGSMAATTPVSSDISGESLSTPAASTADSEPTIQRSSPTPTQTEIDGSLPHTLETSETNSSAGPVASLPITAERPRMTNVRRFSLDYEVDTVGTASVEKVELWGTADGGQTWNRWLEDTDRESPLEVEAGRDGIYGFRIVVTASNQLTSAVPQPGEPADLWVGVDTAKPTVRITSASYGEGDHAGQLEICWEATDENFANGPITLSFSDRRDGPWHTIAAGLANTGRYYWPVEARIPRQIYLRISAHDEAGNVSEYQVSEAISTAGLIPQGRIRGFHVSPQNDRSAERPPIKR